MGSATNDTTPSSAGARLSPYSARCSPASSPPASVPSSPVFPRPHGRGRGRTRWGVRPRRPRARSTGRPSGLLSTAKQAFVDGLGLATAVSAVVVLIAAVLVYKFLPSDRNSMESLARASRSNPPGRAFSTPALPSRRSADGHAAGLRAGCSRRATTSLLHCRPNPPASRGGDDDHQHDDGGDDAEDHRSGDEHPGARSTSRTGGEGEKPPSCWPRYRRTLGANVRRNTSWSRG